MPNIARSMILRFIIMSALRFFMDRKTTLDHATEGKYCNSRNSTWELVRILRVRE
jgi:hypothetical protein